MNAEPWNHLWNRLVKRIPIDNVHLTPPAIFPGLPVTADAIEAVYNILNFIIAEGTVYERRFLVPEQPFYIDGTMHGISTSENTISSEWLETKGFTLTPPLPAANIPTEKDYENCLENANAIVDLLHVISLRSSVFHAPIHQPSHSSVNYTEYSKGRFYNTYEERWKDYFEQSSYRYLGGITVKASVERRYSSGNSYYPNYSTTWVTLSGGQIIRNVSANLLMQYSTSTSDIFDAAGSDFELTCLAYNGNHYPGNMLNPLYSSIHSRVCPCGWHLSPVQNLGRWDASQTFTFGTSNYPSSPSPQSSRDFTATIHLALELLLE